MAKRLISLKYNDFSELENRLENYAKQGLILEKIGYLFYTFKKTKPQNLKYTVTFFKEGSIFNPKPTENQLTYFSYAEAASWDFVCERGQMQIFSSTLENPVPFETDQEQKLTNIHNCVKKSYLPSQIILLLMWIVNLFIRIPSFKLDPSRFLSSKLELLTILLFATSIIFYSYLLISYFCWYRKAKKDVELGLDIPNSYSIPKKIFETFCVWFMLLIVGLMFYYLFENSNFWLIILVILQVPFFILVFSGIVSLLKKFNFSAQYNKICTFIVYVSAVILYCAFIFAMIVNFDFAPNTSKPYRTVQWSLSSGETHSYRLYSDDIPLTCEDLYGKSDYLNYSFEHNTDATFLLKRESYSQTRPPSKNSPPEISYEIYTTKFDFVSDLVIDDLTYIDDVFDIKLVTLDNDIFDTKKAYTFYYQGSGEGVYTGEYVLIFEDKIVYLDFEDVLTDTQINTVIEKLQLN